MPDLGSTTNSEKILKLLLRFLGTTSLFALVFVVAPYSWLDSIHSYLGMGQFPDKPVVGYLARSTSALYAIMGGLFWTVSFDLGRHRLVLRYLGAAITLFGAALLVIDWSEGLPFLWKVWEGPFLIAIGLAIFFLSRKIKTSEGASN